MIVAPQSARQRIIRLEEATRPRLTRPWTPSTFSDESLGFVITYGIMAYIICEPCVGTKDTACVDVCPVDCIHPRKDEAAFAAAEMLYIHPDECIDCGACVPACPVDAIFSLDETPRQWERYIAKNRDYFG